MQNRSSISLLLFHSSPYSIFNLCIVNREDENKEKKKQTNTIEYIFHITKLMRMQSNQFSFDFYQRIISIEKRIEKA